MRTIHRLIYLSVLFQFLYTTAYSANHYVDKNANGLNNGTSWANAWQSFSAIKLGVNWCQEILFTFRVGMLEEKMIQLFIMKPYSAMPRNSNTKNYDYSW